MQLRPTDLPEPVVPATSRCGIGARSAMTGSPAIFLPRISGSDMFWSSNAWLPISSDSATISRFGLGSSMPMTLRPGMVATRADSADMLRAMSSASAITRLALMPLAGSSSYMVTTGPGRTSTMSPRTLKSSSTVSSRRALRSSPARSICWRFPFGRRREQLDRRQLVTVAEREARLRRRGLRPLAAARRRSAWRGSATATVGRDRAERQRLARSSRISVVRGAARVPAARRANKPRKPVRSSSVEAKREIAERQARQARTAAGPQAAPGPATCGLGIRPSAESTPCAAARPSAPPQPAGSPETAEPLVRPSATPSSTAPIAASSKPRPIRPAGSSRIIRRPAMRDHRQEQGRAEAEQQQQRRR